MDRAEINTIIDRVAEERNFDISPEERGEIEVVIVILAALGMASEQRVYEAVMLVGLQKEFPNMPVWYPFLHQN